MSRALLFWYLKHQFDNATPSASSLARNKSSATGTARQIFAHADFCGTAPAEPDQCLPPHDHAYHCEAGPERANIHFHARLHPGRTSPLREAIAMEARSVAEAVGR